MILLDTSIWIDHLRSTDELVGDLLRGRRVAVHPFVIGELALGSFKDRGKLVSSLSKLPSLRTAREAEVLYLIERETLYATGLGYVDAHLLASVRLNPGVQLWTRNKRLLAAAQRMQIAMSLN
jgi:predicted nucleic acid-binding protein